MKWVNPGIVELFDFHSYMETIQRNNSDFTHTGYYILGDLDRGSFLKKTITPTKEGWCSFDIKRGETAYDSAYSLLTGYDAANTCVFNVVLKTDTKEICVYADDSYNNLLYTGPKGSSFNNKTITNFEIHFKTGEEGRIDVWENTKLLMSFRSPSAFKDTEITTIRLFNSESMSYALISSIIYQDTRRIGLEKFQKLTIDPDTEQNMPMGSTTTYKLSGLSDATEFSDITSVCAILQATSRDANITTGTYSIEGADVGTIDVSDSSGKAYEIAHSEINSITGKPWVRDDIEGKTLSFTVNGTAG
jgi:hypothetical protein